MSAVFQCAMVASLLRMNSSIKRSERPASVDYTERALRFVNVSPGGRSVMTRAERPLRADAARNRARVLEVAYALFAEAGVGVPVDEIARGAGVGPGPVCRHFPTKEALFEAVISDRVRRMVDSARAL